MTSPIVPLTTAQAAAALDVNRVQLDKLIAAGWLTPLPVSLGRGRLLDPTQVAALAATPFVPAAPEGAPLRGLALHTANLTEDGDPTNGRRYSGWRHPSAGPTTPSPSPPLTPAELRKAWGGWWNTGAALAAEAVGLVALPTTSGFIGEVGLIVAAHPHPVRPGVTWFETVAVAAEVGAQYAGRRLRPAPGAPWQRF